MRRMTRMISLTIQDPIPFNEIQCFLFDCRSLIWYQKDFCRYSSDLYVVVDALTLRRQSALGRNSMRHNGIKIFEMKNKMKIYFRLQRDLCKRVYISERSIKKPLIDHQRLKLNFGEWRNKTKNRKHIWSCIEIETQRLWIANASCQQDLGIIQFIISVWNECYT